MMMNSKSLLIAVSLVAVATRADAQAFTRLIHFGDSLTDVGNTSDQTFGFSPGSNYYAGRYSNGPVWAETFARDLNLQAPVASRDGGRNYATGGSRTGSGSVAVPTGIPFFTINLPNAGTQINSFLGSSTLGRDDLVTLWTGANDFLDGQTDPNIPANNVRGHVQRLIDAGAKNILVPNLPPLGDTPRYRNSVERATMTARAAHFNAALSTALGGLAAAYPEVNVFGADIFSYFKSALAAPAQFGLTNITEAALRSDGSVAANVDGYLFYDGVHPTRTGHSLLARHAFEQVTTRTFNSVGGGAWAVAANWVQDRVPDSTSAVMLSAAQPAEISLNAGATVRKLTIGQDVTLRLATAALTVTESPANLTGGGTLAGRGTVTGEVRVSDRGAISPGGRDLPIGQISINGSLRQGLGSRLVADLSAADGDRVAVTGAAILGGELVVRFVDGYVALPGTKRTVLTYGSAQGAFAGVTNQTRYPGLILTPIIEATTASVRFSAIAGDANLDAAVNFDDLVTLAQHYNQSAGQDWLDGDFDQSGGVNFTDLVALARHYNGGAAAAAADAAFAADWALAQSLVPEPAAAVGLLLLTTARRRRPLR